MDRRCRFEGLLWIGGTRKDRNSGLATGVGRTGIAAYYRDAQGRQLRRGSVISHGAWYAARRGASPLLSNILLTPFDREMRKRGYQLTRYADDWVVTCSSQAEARAAIAAATKILSALGVQLHPQQTRI